MFLGPNGCEYSLKPKFISGIFFIYYGTVRAITSVLFMKERNLAARTGPFSALYWVGLGHSLCGCSFPKGEREGASSTQITFRFGMPVAKL